VVARDLTFERRIDDLLERYKRRVDRLLVLRALSGTAPRVWVRPFRVASYTVRGHYRTTLRRAMGVRP
jgi:hypothetical protein